MAVELEACVECASGNVLDMDVVNTERATTRYPESTHVQTAFNHCRSSVKSLVSHLRIIKTNEPLYTSKELVIFILNHRWARRSYEH